MTVLVAAHQRLKWPRIIGIVTPTEAVPLMAEYPGGNVSEIQFEISVSST